ncbi:MAG: hypothetical protein WEF86_11340 [Gemmatimonadota bacterium]
MVLLFLTLFVQVQAGAVLPADSVRALRDAARQAEARYERALRNRAPFSWQTGGGTDCDEVVGRFCLRFDSTTVPPSEPEHEDVATARAAAVDAGTRFFTAAPGELAAAGALVRLLVADGRAAEAVGAAREFAAASPDTLWQELLLGLALHAAGSDDAAELHFARALARLDPEERRGWLDPEWLLDPSERSRVAADPDGRAEYERRFWRLADPFWMTPANESWVEHMSRHAQAALLAASPGMSGMSRWGEDLRELTVRYGTPVARTRNRAAAPLPLGGRPGLTEYWDTAQRAYAPARLSEGIPGPSRPGARPALYSARARSAYAFQAVPRVLELQHQITRFLADGSAVLRADGLVVRDTVVADARRRVVPVGLIAYDSTFGARHGIVDEAVWKGDSALFTLRLRVPAGRIVYGVEALDTAALVGARARFALEGLPAQTGPVVSDLLICAPFTGSLLPNGSDDPVLRAHTSLVVQRGDTLGVYAEVYGLSDAGAQLGIELALEPAGTPSAVGRLARWAGEALGVIGPASKPRVAWWTDGERGVHSIALNLPLDPAIRGPHVLVLRVTDRASGRSAESRREIHAGPV